MNKYICLDCIHYIYEKDIETENEMECCTVLQSPHPFYKRTYCIYYKKYREVRSNAGNSDNDIDVVIKIIPTEEESNAST